jgi:nucleoid DNA-binding protein
MATTRNESSLVGREALTKAIANETDLTQKQASDALTVLLKTTEQSLKEGNEVRLVGFGSFKVRTSAARAATNPRTREKVAVPEQNRVRFSPGKELAAAVSKK